MSRLIDAAPDQQRHRRTDPQALGTAAAADHPAKARRKTSARICNRARHTLFRTEQQGRNPAVAQLPDRAIQNEMVNIHQRRKDQEARAEVMAGKLLKNANGLLYARDGTLSVILRTRRPRVC